MTITADIEGNHIIYILFHLYHKTPKFSDSQEIAVIILKFE